MLSRANSYILFILILSFNGCAPGSRSNEFFKTSQKVVGKVKYEAIYKLAKDNLDNWITSKLFAVKVSPGNSYHLDSLICLNKDGRLISCIHLYMNEKNSNSDGLNYFSGEKINEKWYFYPGPFIVIPRSMVKGQNESIPLSYQQLHDIAIKEVYNGYLKSNGGIDDQWFTNQFEQVGICSDCKTREDYQKNILTITAAMWVDRDTTKPIIRLNKKESLP